MSNYILNINKYRSTTTPQIVGRVADLPKLPIEVQILDGDKPVDLTSATVEFRELLRLTKKIIVTSGITVTNKVTGSFTFTFPKNFYTSPGRFKRAYFVIKRGERLDSTQDLIIHVIESIDFDLDESEDIIEGLDQVIKEVTDKMNKETQAMIDAIQKEYDNLEKLLNQQAQNNIAKIDKEIKITIDESKLRMQQLESEYRGVINNAQLTLNQLQAEVDELKPYVDDTNKKLQELDNNIKVLEKKINDNDLVKRPEFLKLKDDFDNLTQININSISGSNWESERGTSFRFLNSNRSEIEFKTNKGNKWPRIINKSPNFVNWIEGEKYTISFYIKVDKPDTTNTIRSLISTKVGAGNISGVIPITPTSEYQLISKTFEYVDKSVEDVIYFQIFPNYSSSDADDLTIWIKDVTLTDSNNVHIWNPNLDDIAYTWNLDEVSSKTDELEIKNNRLTQGVDFIKPPLSGYKKGDTWYFEKNTSFPGMNLLDDSKEHYKKKEQNEIRLFLNISEPGEYRVKFDYEMDEVGSKPKIFAVFLSGASKYITYTNDSGTMTDVFNVTQTGRVILNINFGNGPSQSRQNSGFLRNISVTKGVEEYNYSTSPKDIIGETGVLTSNSNNNQFDFNHWDSYDGDLYKPNIIDLQKQIDELSKIVTALGGS